MDFHHTRSSSSPVSIQLISPTRGDQKIKVYMHGPVEIASEVGFPFN